MGFPESWVCISETIKAFSIFFLAIYVGSIHNQLTRRE